MNNLQWVEEYQNKLGKEAFDQFLNKIYGWLMALQPGQSLNLYTHKKITDRNRELVIEICKLFISEGNPYYEFTADRTQIKNNRYVPGRTSKPKKNKDVAKQGKGISI